MSCFVVRPPARSLARSLAELVCWLLEGSYTVGDRVVVRVKRDDAGIAYLRRFVDVPPFRSSEQASERTSERASQPASQTL